MPDSSVKLVPVSRRVLPLLHVIEQMLAEYEYCPMSEELIELLCREPALLAALQRLAFLLMPSSPSSSSSSNSANSPYKH